MPVVCDIRAILSSLRNFTEWESQTEARCLGTDYFLIRQEEKMNLSQQKGETVR